LCKIKKHTIINIIVFPIGEIANNTLFWQYVFYLFKSPFMMRFFTFSLLIVKLSKFFYDIPNITCQDIQYHHNEYEMD